MRTALNHWHVYVAALLLAGCAQLEGLFPAPQSFNDKALAVQSLIVEVRTTNTTLLNAKKISSKDAQQVQKTADVAQEGLDVARAIALHDLNTADGKLSALRTGLLAVANYLAARK